MAVRGESLLPQHYQERPTFLSSLGFSETLADLIASKSVSLPSNSGTDCVLSTRCAIVSGAALIASSGTVGWRDLFLGKFSNLTFKVVLFKLELP